MKKIFLLSLLIIILFTGISSAADISVQTGMNYDWWEDSRDNKGSQFYIPLGIQAQMKDFSFGVLTAYTYTKADPAGLDSRSLSTSIDTKVNTSYTIINRLPVDILIGLDFNIPTGKTNFKQEDLILITDPDLITINNFGEGFNINPTLILAKQFGKWVIGVGTGYLWRGEYDFSSDINMKDYDPGDIFNINGEIRYYISPKVNARFFSGYVWYDKDKKEGDKFYQEGSMYFYGVGLVYNQPKWDAGLTLKSILRNKSKIQEGTRGLSTEDKNSHGDEWIADLEFRYLLNDKTALKSSLQGLLITENDYQPNEDRYMGKREKLSLGLGISRIFSKHIEGLLGVKGFIMHDDKTQFPEFRSSCDYKGFSLTALLTTRF